MEIERFRQLRQLAQEIANTAFWSAEVTKVDIEAVYNNPISGAKSEPIHLSNRDEWTHYRAQVEGKPLSKRVNELEHQLARLQWQNARMRGLLTNIDTDLSISPIVAGNVELETLRDRVHMLLESLEAAGGE